MSKKIVLCLCMVLMVPAPLLAQATQIVTPVPGGAITVTPIPINISAGDQFDPHVDGDLVSYSEITATQQVRYYQFSTGADTAISNVLADGTVVSDLLSDVQGGRIVFTRIGPYSNAIMMFNPATMTAPQEINPVAGSNRIGVAIGGPSLAYVDLGLARGGEIMHVDLGTNAVTRLTDDSLADQSVAVSPDGNVIVWEHCTTSLSNCNINQAVLSAGAWAVTPVTSSTFAQESPDTNGSLVVYDSNRGAASDGYDLFYKPVAGGAETRLQLPGDQVHASIAGGYIAFESRAVGSPNSDIYLYEIATNRIFQITDTPNLNESLNDVTVLPNGDVRLVWDSDDEIIAHNVYGATITVPPLPPLLTCNNQHGTPLADYTVFRRLSYVAYHLPAFGTATFQNPPANPAPRALVCMDAINTLSITGGYVVVNVTLVGQPPAIGPGFTHYENFAPIRTGLNLSGTLVNGDTGAGIRVRIWPAY